MDDILLWSGIILIVAGWIALAWEATRRMAAKEDLERFPDRRDVMRLRRNYCRVTILAGVVLLLGSLTL